MNIAIIIVSYLLISKKTSIHSSVLELLVKFHEKFHFKRMPLDRIINIYNHFRKKLYLKCLTWL